MRGDGGNDIDRGSGDGSGNEPKNMGSFFLCLQF